MKFHISQTKFSSTWCKYKSVFPFVILLAIFVTTASAEDKKLSSALLQDAVQQHEAGNFEKWHQDLENAKVAANAAGHKRDEALSLSGLGDYARELTMPAMAHEQYEKALALWQELGERKEEARTLLNLGMVWEDLGQAPAARERYLAALKIFRATDDLSGEAEALRQIGSSYLLENQIEKGSAYILQAISLYHDEKLSDKANEALALSLLGVSYRQRQLYSEALKSFQDALKLQQELKNRVYIAELTQKIGMIYLLLGQASNASASASAAASMWRNLGDRGHEMGASVEQAVALTLNGESDVALPILRQALEIMEGPRESYSYLRFDEISYFRQISYPLMLKLLLQQHQPEEAFLWAQRSKVARLRDELIVDGKESTFGATSEELQEEKKLREHVKVSRSQLMARQIHKNKMTSEDGPVRDADLAESELYRFTTSLYQRHPRLKQLRLAEGLRLNEVGNFLPDDTALLEYAKTGLPWEDKMVLFCVTMRAGRSIVKAYPLGPAQPSEIRAPLKSLVEDFRIACTDPQRQAEFSGWDLNEILLGKATSDYMGKRRLLIGPADFLWGMPFGALPDEDGVPLAEKFEIAYTPNITLTQIPMPQNPESLRASPSSNITRPKRAMALLGTSTAQAATLKNLFPDAAVSNLLNLASDARLLHIGAPLTLRDDFSLKSYLARPMSSKPLLLGDIFDLKASARICVIAPSQVKMPANRTGIYGGIWELIHYAFLRSGITTQIITFDGTPEKRATPFLKAFCTKLKEGRSVAAAQRDAIRLLRANPKTAHPAYWAPFFLFGNWQQKM